MTEGVAAVLLGQVDFAVPPGETRGAEAGVAALGGGAACPVLTGAGVTEVDLGVTRVARGHSREAVGTMTGVGEQRVDRPVSKEFGSDLHRYF